MSDDRQRLRHVLDALYRHLGREELAPSGDILATLVRAMLSQATSAANSGQAFRQLLDAFGGDWDLARQADVDDVAALIAIGGLAWQKAPRILALLEQVERDFGRCSLEALREWEPARARDYLASFKGVGPKTAAFTLMRAARMDIFPMNGGILRALRRLGFLDGSESDQAAHEKMGRLVPVGESHAAHVALVRHARRSCRSRRPDCTGCTIAEWCPRIGVEA